jgi:hypothetical protein
MSVDAWKEAAAKGARHYFTGQPCKRGHVAPRFVSNTGCTECAKLTAAEKAAADAPKTFRFPNLHADDHAEARAFCQMLQARRGQHVEM